MTNGKSETKCTLSRSSEVQTFRHIKMRHVLDEDPYLQEQARQRQEKPKLDKIGKLERIKIPRKKFAKAKSKITQTAA